MKMENGIQCLYNYYYLFYRSNLVQIFVVMVVNFVEVVLLVFFVNIGNVNGLFKCGNVFLDFGLQISLIK